MVKNLLLFFFLGFIHNASAQVTFSISGIVKDKNEVLVGAGVYVSGYKIATVTNGDGKFALSGLKPGNYDILVQMIGYQPLSRNIIIADKSVVVELKLIESTIRLNAVEIKPDPNRNWHINLFKEFFIGKTPNSAECQILNTHVLVIDDDKVTQTINIKATDFLIMENLALGYRIKYLLEQFTYNFSTKILFYSGYPTFEEMKGSNSKQKRWAKNREIAYKGSIQHFYTTLYQNKIEEEGFIINKRYEFPNPNRLPDSVIRANYKKLLFYDEQKKRYSLDTKSEAYLEWRKQDKEPKTSIAIVKDHVLADTLVKKFNDNLKMINFKDELFVSYKNERETELYENSSYFQNRPKELKNYQVSAVKMLVAPIYFYSQGSIHNPRSTLYSGFWAYEKMADSVPMDYIAREKK